MLLDYSTKETFLGAHCPGNKNLGGGSGVERSPIKVIIVVGEHTQA